MKPGLERGANTRLIAGVRVRALGALSDGVFRDGVWTKRRILAGTTGTVVGQFSDFNVFDVAFDGLPEGEVMSPTGHDIRPLSPLEHLAEILTK